MFHHAVEISWLRGQSVRTSQLELRLDTDRRSYADGQALATIAGPGVRAEAN